jgi:hypothetical protein
MWRSLAKKNAGLELCCAALSCAGMGAARAGAKKGWAWSEGTGLELISVLFQCDAN